MKFVISPDSFKDSISAKDAAAAIKKGICSVFGENHEYILAPIADGGEGTLDALVQRENFISLSVIGTSGERVTAEYGFVGDCAVIEMARAAGLMLTPPEKRSAMSATTYGVGELILNALDRNFRKILLTVGGSGTNDGGSGMVAALGVRFKNKDGDEFIPTGGTLSDIEDIDISGLDRRLLECEITIATDVTNPLVGESGATYVYGKQKGATDAELADMENGMKHYAELLLKCCGRSVSDMQGCGAGGGIAAPLLAMTEAAIRSGIEAVLATVNYLEIIKGADIIISGEGKIDRQSLYGKAISGVAKYGNAENIPVYCFVGCIGDDKELLKSMGIADIYALADIAPSAEYSMSHPAELLEKISRNFAEHLQ